MHDADQKADRTAELERALESARARVAALGSALHERTRQLEQVEASLWQMSWLFSRVSIPIMLLDLLGNIQDLNAEAERILGRDRMDLIGKPLTSILPADRRELANELIARCRSGDTVLNAAGQLWGVTGDLHAARTKLFPLIDQHQEVVGMAIADDVGQLKATGDMLENVNRELRRLALVDGLTQLANRREFERVFEREFQRAQRSRNPLSLAMIDVDAFKNFNDASGHAAGDACLHAVATGLRSSLRRPADFVARYGGEEFAMLLPNTAFAGAVASAERTRASIEALRIEHPDSPTSAYVTVSVGVATAIVEPRTPPALLRASADEALYAAKRSGRNRVRSVDLTKPIENADTRDRAPDVTFEV